MFFDIIDVGLSITSKHDKFVYSEITFTCVQISTYQDFFQVTDFHNLGLPCPKCLAYSFHVIGAKPPQRFLYETSDL